MADPTVHSGGSAGPAEDPLAVELRALAGWLDVPPAGDLRPAVRARLAVRVRPRRRWRVLVAAAVAALLVAAVPPARAAVAHAVSAVLDFAGVRVRQGQPAPARSPSPLPSIRSVALDRARALARFPIGVPAALGTPQDVQLADPDPAGVPRVVSLLYRGGTVRLDEFDGQLDYGFLKTGNVAEVQWLRIDNQDALWLPAGHAIEYVGRDGAVHHETARLAGPTLVWSANRVTYRLEGLSTVDEAIVVQRSVS
jgi:hypothetical protein